MAGGSTLRGWLVNSEERAGEEDEKSSISNRLPSASQYSDKAGTHPIDALNCLRSERRRARRDKRERLRRC